jgi:adenylylsulfate kinase-like enzyme
MTTVVLVHGLPGSGKTTLADMLEKLILGSCRINADQIRNTISKDLKFSITDRKMQAYRLGAISGIALALPIQVVGASADSVQNYNSCVIVDFVNPTEETRSIFRWALRTTLVSGSSINLVEIWMNTISKEDSRFKDTSILYCSPDKFDYEVQGWKTPEELQMHATKVVKDFFKPKRFL